jgi:hypothetical protein
MHSQIQNTPALRPVFALSLSVLAAAALLGLAVGSHAAQPFDWHSFQQAQAAIGVGAFVLTGLDTIVEASLTRAMPDWLVSVTTVKLTANE